MAGDPGNVHVSSTLTIFYKTILRLGIFNCKQVAQRMCSTDCVEPDSFNRWSSGKNQSLFFKSTLECKGIGLNVLDTGT